MDPKNLRFVGGIVRLATGNNFVVSTNENRITCTYVSETGRRVHLEYHKVCSVVSGFLYVESRDQNSEKVFPEFNRIVNRGTQHNNILVRSVLRQRY